MERRSPSQPLRVVLRHKHLGQPERAQEGVRTWASMLIRRGREGPLKPQGAD